MMRTMTAGLVALWLCIGCQNTPSETIRFGLASAPITFDPRYATDAASTRLIRLLYERLVEFDDQTQPVAGAARWELLAPTHYRFKLQRGAYPIAGDRYMTARDVKATYESVLDPATASPHRQALDNIARVEEVDEQTVDFILKVSDPVFPGRLVISVMAADLLAAHHPFAEKPVGSGAFVLLARPHETQVLFQRRQDQQAFEFVTVKDPTVRILKLMRGEVDIVQDDLQPELVHFLESQSQGVTIAKARGTRFSYLGFNLADPVTSQLGVRHAIAMAIDRREIVRYVFADSARLAASLLPPDHWAGHPE
jgi:peptide/nickel transport system substrate-binding protein